MLRVLAITIVFSATVSAADAPKPPVGAFKLRSLGPALTSGRIVGFAVHPKDRSTYYVAVACGGVWKTTNSGTTWTPIFDNQGSFSIGCVVLDPKNPNTVWVGTGENNSQRSVAYGDGVYKSLDGGRTWDNVGLKSSEHIGKIVIDPRDSDTVYVAAQGPLWSAGGDRGLYKTTDGGRNWTKLLDIDENTGVTDLIQHPTQPDIMLAASYQRRRHVWTLINGGPGSALHRSTDGGRSWKKVGGLPGGDLGRIGLAYAPSEPDTMYTIVEAAEGQGGIFRSQDKGLTWQKRNPFDQQAQYYSHLVVDPVDKNRLYAMSVLIQVSDDGGATLRTLGERAKHVDNHALWIDPSNTDYYLCGCDGGIYESFDRAANWHFKSNLPVTQFYDVAVDQNPASGPFYHVYGGTQDNFTLGGPVRNRSRNGINNGDWYVVQGGDGFHCAVDPTDPNIVYAESQYAGLCRFDRRTGNRVEIQPQAAPNEPPLRWNWDSPFIISPNESKRLYFAANRVWKSDDRGDSWKPISDDLTRQIDRDKLPVFGKIQGVDAVAKHVSTSFYGNIVSLAESPKQAGLIYAGTDDGLICVTENDGGAWKRFEAFPGVPDRCYVSKLVASRHEAKTLYAAFDNHKKGDFKPYLVKSTDAGRTWLSVSGDLPERGTVYSFAEDHVNPKLLFCGTEFGLYVTVDGGTTWNRMKGGLPTIMVKDLVIQRANDDLVVATFGRGFYVIDDYSALRSLTPEAMKKDLVLPPRDVVLYVPSAQYGGRGQAFQGASFYLADNPDYGATFVVNVKEGFKSLKQKRKDAERAAENAKKDPPLPTPEQLRKEAEEETPSALLVISDASGAVVRRLSVPTSAGVHRVTWNLLQIGNALAMPGTYNAKLIRVTAGKSTDLGEPATMKILPDPLSNLTAKEYERITAFDTKVKAARQTQSLINASIQDSSDTLEKMKRAIDASEKDAGAAGAKIITSQQAIRKLQRTLTGDNLLRGRNVNTVDSVADRLNYAAFANSGALAPPTTTQKQQLEYAEKALSEAVKTAKSIADGVAAIEEEIVKAGVPWVLK